MLYNFSKKQLFLERLHLKIFQYLDCLTKHIVLIKKFEGQIDICYLPTSYLNIIWLNKIAKSIIVLLMQNMADYFRLPHKHLIISVITRPKNQNESLKIYIHRPECLKSLFRRQNLVDVSTMFVKREQFIWWTLNVSPKLFPLNRWSPNISQSQNIFLRINTSREKLTLRTHLKAIAL